MCLCKKRHEPNPQVRSCHKKVLAKAAICLIIHIHVEIQSAVNVLITPNVEQPAPLLHRPTLRRARKSLRTPELRWARHHPIPCTEQISITKRERHTFKIKWSKKHSGDTFVNYCSPTIRLSYFLLVWQRRRLKSEP